MNDSSDGIPPALLTRAVDQVAEEIDHAELVDDLLAEKPAFLAAVRAKLTADLRAMAPRDAWSVRVLSLDGESVLKPGSEGHLGALWAMFRKKKYHGNVVESGVVHVVSAIIEQALIQFYQREEVARLLADRLSRQLQHASAVTQDHIAEELSGDLFRLGQEIRDNIVSNPAKTIIIDKAVDGVAGAAQSVAASLHTFLASATGQQLLSLIAHVMATGAGKVVLTQMASVVAKVATSGIMKTTVVTLIEKVGVTALLKTVIGKAILVAVFGGLGLPFEFITLALVAAILPWQYRQLPVKLSKAVPDKVVAVLDEKYAELHEALVPIAARRMLDDLLWAFASRVAH